MSKKLGDKSRNHIYETETITPNYSWDSGQAKGIKEEKAVVVG